MPRQGTMAMVYRLAGAGRGKKTCGAGLRSGPHIMPGKQAGESMLKSEKGPPGNSCTDRLQRHMPCPRPAFDGGGVEAVYLQLVADFFEQPEFRLADCAVGGGDVAGERVGGFP